MNLHQIVSGAIAAINPFTAGTIRISTGYTTAGAGTRTPTYTDLAVSIQIQALSFQDLQLIDGLQLNAEGRAMYVNGQFDSVNRPTNGGGDLIIFPDGGVWPYSGVWWISNVVEQWPDWCKLITVQQLDA